MVNKKAPKGLPTKTATVNNGSKATNLNPSAVIKFTKLGASGNPKRPNTGAYTLYTYYKNGITVGAYVNAVKAGGVRPNAARVAIAWDVARGFITVS